MKGLSHIGIVCGAALTGLAITGAGCASDQRPHDVPSSAMRTVEGNQRLVYTAADPGTVWVTEGDNNIIYSTPVTPGDRVVLDPELGKVMMNDRVVLDKDVNHNNHKVFFMPGAAPPSAVTASDRTISRPEGVPATAVIGGEGKDRVEYTVQRDGYAWVTDEDRHSVLFAGPVNRGDVMTVDPQKHMMTVNGRTVLKDNVESNNHRIFFSTDRPVWRSAGKDLPAAAADAVRPADVPADAMSRVEGSGRIDFVAERDGTVWVTDATAGRTVYSGRILKNDRLTLDPAGNRLSVNGQAVHTPELANDRYRVFFSER